MLKNLSVLHLFLRPEMPTDPACRMSSEVRKIVFSTRSFDKGNSRSFVSFAEIFSCDFSMRNNSNYFV